MEHACIKQVLINNRYKQPSENSAHCRHAKIIDGALVSIRYRSARFSSLMHTHVRIMLAIAAVQLANNAHIHAKATHVKLSGNT
jgi:hypothetical protein